MPCRSIQETKIQTWIHGLNCVVRLRCTTSSTNLAASKELVLKIAFYLYTYIISWFNIVVFDMFPYNIKLLIIKFVNADLLRKASEKPMRKARKPFERLRKNIISFLSLSFFSSNRCSTSTGLSKLSRFPISRLDG